MEFILESNICGPIFDIQLVNEHFSIAEANFSKQMYANKGFCQQQIEKKFRK